MQGTSCRWTVNCLDVDWFPNSSADIVLGHEQENIGCSSARLIQDHRSKHADTSEIKAELPAARLVLLEALSSRSFGGNRWNRGACRRWEELAGGGEAGWQFDRLGRNPRGESGLIESTWCLLGLRTCDASGRRRGRRGSRRLTCLSWGEAQVWFITNRGLGVVSPSNNQQRCCRIRCGFSERSDTSDRTNEK